MSLSLNGVGFTPGFSIDDVEIVPTNLIVGSAGTDVRFGTAAADEFRGLAGRDLFYGGDGGDLVDGGTGIDLLAGGRGDDLYLVDDRCDIVLGLPGGGRDTIASTVDWTLGSAVEALRLVEGSGAARGIGNGLDNAIYGNAGANVLDGKGGDDLLSGGGGNDDLRGGAGRDMLEGGAGFDRLAGGTGAGLFRFAAIELSSGCDLGRIDDFNRADGDRIDLAGLGAQTFRGTAPLVPVEIDGNGVDPGQFRYEKVAGGVRLEGDSDFDGVRDWTIFVAGTDALTAGNFIAM